MEYPSGFPKNLQPPVDRVLAEAEVTLRATASHVHIDDCYRAEYRGTRNLVTSSTVAC